MKELYDLTDGQSITPIVVQPKLDPNGGLTENEDGISTKMYDAFNGGVPLNYTYGGKRVYYGRKTYTNVNLTTGGVDYPAIIDSSKYVLSYRVYFNDNSMNNILAPFYHSTMGAMATLRPNTNVLVLFGTGNAVKTWLKVEVEFEYIDR